MLFPILPAIWWQARKQSRETAGITQDGAYLAGLAVGYWDDVDDIRKNWALSKTFVADMPEELRNEKLAGWKRAVRCALAWAEE